MARTMVEMNLENLDKAVADAQAALDALKAVPLTLPEKCSKAEVKRLTTEHDQRGNRAHNGARQAERAVREYENTVLAASSIAGRMSETLAECIGMAGCVSPRSRTKALEQATGKGSYVTVDFGIPAGGSGSCNVRANVNKDYDWQTGMSFYKVEVSTAGSTYDVAGATAYATALTAAAQFAAQVQASCCDKWLSVDDGDVALVEGRRAARQAVADAREAARASRFNNSDESAPVDATEAR